MKKLKKLSLKKEIVTKLGEENMAGLKGGFDTTDTPPLTSTYGITVGNCDLPSIGHDDGSYCLSKTDWGWCWCYGQ